MPVKLFSRSSSSFSLVEVLVAVTFISLILTALSINMVYTQRSIKNSQMRAKAIDQANACLDKFRNLRDSNIWLDFCTRLDPNLNQCQQNLGTGGSDEYRCNFSYSPSLDETGRCINCFTSAGVCNSLTTAQKRDGITADNDIYNRVDHLGPTCYEENYLVCEEFITDTNNFHYEGKYYVSFQRGQLDPNANTAYPSYLSPFNTGCYKTNTADSKEFARVSITVEYQDFSNVTQHVTVYQDFAKSDYEAPYNSPSIITAPSQCNPPRILHPITQTCVCSNGGEWNGVECKVCPADQPYNYSIGDCYCAPPKQIISGICQLPSTPTPSLPPSSCPAGQILIGGVCQCQYSGQILIGGVCQCPSNQYLSNGSCLPCSSGTHSTGFACITCPPTATWNEEQRLCECPGELEELNGKCACPSGQIQNGNQCEDCPEGQTSYNGTSCNSLCTLPTPVWNGSTCAPCPNNTPYWNGTTCVTCPSGQYWNGLACSNWN